MGAHDQTPQHLKIRMLIASVDHDIPASGQRDGVQCGVLGGLICDAYVLRDAATSSQNVRAQ